VRALKSLVEACRPRTSPRTELARGDPTKCSAASWPAPSRRARLLRWRCAFRRCRRRTAPGVQPRCRQPLALPSLDPARRRCHRDASSPTRNSSNRPSRPKATAGLSRRNFIPDGASCGLQPDQAPLGAVCLICRVGGIAGGRCRRPVCDSCHRAPSVPMTKTCILQIEQGSIRVRPVLRGAAGRRP
jgi:hypothetical protein